MPAAYVQKMVDEGKGSKADLEHKWNKAKQIAEDAGRKEDWPYIMGIFKKAAGISTAMALAGLKAVKAFNYGDNNMTTTVNAGENAYLESLVDSGKFSRAEVDQAWEKAKKIANDEAAKNPKIVPSYAYTTAIFQNLLGIKKTASFRLNAAARLRGQ